jgi:hypothetical protein
MDLNECILIWYMYNLFKLSLVRLGRKRLSICRSHATRLPEQKLRKNKLITFSVCLSQIQVLCAVVK